jgi:kinesin family protein 5
MALQENASMSSELNELRKTTARLESDAKDAGITLDTYKDRVAELQRDIEEQKAVIEELKKVQHREKEEEKEKRKQEMLSEMMAKIDMVRTSSPTAITLASCSDMYREDSSTRRLTKVRVGPSSTPQARSSDRCLRTSRPRQVEGIRRVSRPKRGT